MNKLIFIMPSLKTGGGNRVFFELANCILDQYEVTVVYPFNNIEGNSFVIDKRIRFQSVGKFAPSKIKKVFNLFKTIIFVNKNYSNIPILISDPLFCIFIAFLKDKKNIYRFIQADDYSIFDANHVFTNNLFIKIYKLLCKLSYEVKVNYIFNSNFTYNAFLKISKRNDVPCHLVYPAVNHSIFFNRHNSNRDKNFSICVVGRQHKLKGLATFQFALKNLSDEIKDKICSIYIISHEDLSNFLFPDKVIFIKPKSDAELAEYYNKSTVFISTSWWEGFGLPALEAMSCGCAVITSDNQGCHEYAFDRKNCLYFEPKNDLQLMNCIKEVLENVDLRNCLSKQAEIDSKKFSWENSAIQLIEIITK